MRTCKGYLSSTLKRVNLALCPGLLDSGSLTCPTCLCYELKISPIAAHLSHSLADSAQPQQGGHAAGEVVMPLKEFITSDLC